LVVARARRERWSTLVGSVERVVGRRQIVDLELDLGLWDMVVEVLGVVAQVGLVGIGMGGGAQSGLIRRTTFWLLCWIQSSV
jgi:hypothetical protein